MDPQAPGDPTDGSPPPVASAAPSTGSQDWIIIVIAIGAGTGLLLLGVLVVDITGRCIRSGWSAKLVFRGAVTAPLPSPSLTLLLSDIEVRVL